MTCQSRDPRSIADLTAQPRFAEPSSSVLLSVSAPTSPPGIPEALELPEEQNCAAEEQGALPAASQTCSPGCASAPSSDPREAGWELRAEMGAHSLGAARTRIKDI